MLRTSILLIAILSIVVAKSCHSWPPTYGQPNYYPINDGSVLKELQSVENGTLYQLTVPNNGTSPQTVRLLHLWGSAYSMGYAQGSLLKDIAPSLVDSIWAYFESQVDSLIPNFPKWLQDMIADFGLDAALDITYYATIEYSPPHFYQELHGIADASGCDYNTLVRIHMIPGLTQGACSMLGAWNDALASKSGLLQMRALDWDMDGPFRDFSQITVYHPDTGNTFVTLGYSMFIGGLTGVSDKQMAISEIGATYPDASFGSESRIGEPFIWVLRDILQFDRYLDDSITRLINTRRTCDLILGVGDGKLGAFRGFEYSCSVLDVMDDTNMRPTNSTWHQLIPNVVYWGMDWDCPSYNYILGHQIEKYYGNLSAEVGIKYITSVEQSGTNHIAYYDLTNMNMYAAFAAPFNVTGPLNAYERQFTVFNLKTLFSEPRPSL